MTTPFDTRAVLKLDLPDLLAQLASSREAELPGNFLFTLGVSLHALRQAGYRLVVEETPIAPDDRWRLALWAELEAGEARWQVPEVLTSVRFLLLHLVPPD